MPSNPAAWIWWLYDKLFWLLIAALLLELIFRSKLQTLLLKISEGYRRKKWQQQKEIEREASHIQAEGDGLDSFYSDYEKSFRASNRWDSITFLIFGVAAILGALSRNQLTTGVFSRSASGLMLFAALISTTRSNIEWNRFLRCREISHILKHKSGNKYILGI